MLRIKNFTTGKILQNIYGHFINYVTKREEFVNFDNLPESRPRQDVSTGPQGSGYMTKGWIRWNEAPSPTTPIGWVVYDENPSALEWIPFFGELSGDFALPSSTSTNSRIFYSVIGKQVCVSGYILFDNSNTNIDIFITLPTDIKSNFGVVYNLGDLIVTTQNNNNVFKVNSSAPGYQNIQIAFMLA